MSTKKGLILINAYADENDHPQAKRLAEELTLLGVSMDVRRNDFFPYTVSGFVKGELPYDFCLYLDKDKYTAAAMEKSGLRLFDRAQAIEICDDKMTTQLFLAGSGIPMPDALPGFLCYTEDAVIRDEVIDGIISRLGLPVIVKLAYGSLGMGVFKADSREELAEIAEQVKPYPHLFQRYIKKSAGRDMRVIVIGGRVIGGIIRSSRSDFRSNIGLGGTAKKTAVPPIIQEYAIKAANLIGLDYCGLDFLLGDEPMLCEVNSNAYFAGFEEATGINVAKEYAEHIVKTVNGFKSEE